MAGDKQIIGEPFIPQTNDEMIVEPEEHKNKEMLPDQPKNTKALLTENKEEK